ncbi:lyase family protein [Leucobacter sp. NPDC077196]|uniref:lyase family protein n=1 Tax=Leucobacter sp. NPDC077196 TaxID=3154959 RepID=UPI0034245120
MPTDPDAHAPRREFDAGLLSPASAGSDAVLADAEVLGALVATEVALVRAWAEVGVAPRAQAAELSSALGWRGTGEVCTGFDAWLPQLAEEAPSGGNPVIPLVPQLRDRTAPELRHWVHRGATSQDVLDSALMLIAHRAGRETLQQLRQTETALAQLAHTGQDRVAVARTLTQHAVPTTFGLRVAGWLRGVRRATERLSGAMSELPAQIAGAGGTLAGYVAVARAELGSEERAVSAVGELPAAFAAELGLATPEGPWHTVRWPVTELGDALVQSVDALGVLAADVTTLSRTEIGEVAESRGGGSSAMPQKRNPAHAVLIRSAAIRAPHLGATLHAASALAVDERPDGAWHAEWPTLRELLRLALGASTHAAELAAGLAVDTDAIAHNLGKTSGLIVAERLSIVLGPIIGAERVRDIVSRVRAGAALIEMLSAESGLAEALAARGGPSIEELADPAQYVGLARQLVDAALGSPAHTDAPAPTEEPG